MALVAAACALCAQAGGDWKETLGKVKDLSGDTGIAGFARKAAPAYITGDFEGKDRPAAPDFTKPVGDPAAYANKNGFWVTSDAQAKKLSTERHEVKKGDWIGGYFDDAGAFVRGHEVKVLGGPLGLHSCRVLITLRRLCLL